MIPRRVQRPPPRLVSRLGAPAPLDDAVALPADAVRVLRLMAAEMRDMPRDCATDRRELVHWLSRLARRLDALADSKAHPVALAPPFPRSRPETPPAGAAEAVAAIPAPIEAAPRAAGAASPPGAPYAAVAGRADRGLGPAPRRGRGPARPVPLSAGSGAHRCRSAGSTAASTRSTGASCPPSSASAAPAAGASAAAGRTAAP